MNFTCPPNIKQINNNNVKVTTENSTKNSAPQKTTSSAAVSPTSDYVDDSGVSEDNISSANSSSDQGISIYSTEASPISYHYTTTTPTNNNNSLTNKNRNLINNINHQPPPASSIVHLSPGGSTVIEYKTSANNLSNKVQTSKYATAVPIVTVATSSSATSKPLHANIVNDLSNKNSNDNNSQSTPHQHFHKRYLREEHDKMMKQINEAAAESTAVSTSAPASIINASTTTYTIPIKQHYSPTKYEHETVIVENDHPQTTTIGQNHFEHIERSDDYITPGNSPRQNDNLHPPQAPQKTMMVTTATPPVTPNSVVSVQNSVETTSPNSNAAASQQNKQKHPNNLPYDPFIHTNNKPPLSFSSLIFLAIEDAKEKALPVKEIYSWIVQHYPYFKTAPTGWKNSVRHNLSLNKCFQKVEKAPVSVDRILREIQNPNLKHCSFFFLHLTF